MPTRRRPLRSGIRKRQIWAHRRPAKVQTLEPLMVETLRKGCHGNSNTTCPSMGRGCLAASQGAICLLPCYPVLPGMERTSPSDAAALLDPSDEVFDRPVVAAALLLTDALLLGLLPLDGRLGLDLASAARVHVAEVAQPKLPAASSSPLEQAWPALVHVAAEVQGGAKGNGNRLLRCLALVREAADVAQIDASWGTFDGDLFAVGVLQGQHITGQWVERVLRGADDDVTIVEAVVFVLRIRLLGLGLLPGQRHGCQSLLEGQRPQARMAAGTVRGLRLPGALQLGPCLRCEVPVSCHVLRRHARKLGIPSVRG
mmetsp:Transcript_55223/g.176978  ORF Transcript_55223/g.176978 Transcript_55223/m.176978 type:complete len:314 (+) Transcript_55223:160-1101(+)